ncbi:MAG TPA: NADH-quinone oxidoreductase subunit C [Mycobacteriales bacterium]|nr:NADH-quinone oxidoreductase subunit C [Mycobacteriales bacterium]
MVALVGAGAECSVTFGEVTVDVPRDRWLRAVTAARDDPEVAAAFFDWLSAVDETDRHPAGISVLAHLYSLSGRHHLLLRTQVPVEDPRLPTVTGVFAGAGWHERETSEMFGVVFDGHPDPGPLLLPDGFEGHPLRKDFVLATRVARDWPGAPRPVGGGAGAGRRARMRPPGVPDPTRWGPAADHSGARDD